jgi:hypothetical protein
VRGGARSLLKHGAATVVTVAALDALLVALYLALLAWAMVTDGGVGSPATLPIVLVFALVLMTVVCVAVFLPVTAAASWIRSRAALNLLFEIPIAAALLVIYILVIATGFALSKGASLAAASWYASAAALALLPLLGLYWLCLQSTGWLLTGGERAVDFVRRSRGDDGADDDRIGPF